MAKQRSLIIHYIILASGCTILGIIITFLLLLACQYFGIDIFQNLWVLGIPVTLSVTLNVILIEMWRRYGRK